MVPIISYHSLTMTWSRQKFNYLTQPVEIRVELRLATKRRLFSSIYLDATQNFLRILFPEEICAEKSVDDSSKFTSYHRRSHMDATKIYRMDNYRLGLFTFWRTVHS